MDQASSIGIIGGADGPTAVFITSRFPVMTVLLFAAVCAAAALLALYIRKR